MCKLTTMKMEESLLKLDDELVNKFNNKMIEKIPEKINKIAIAYHNADADGHGVKIIIETIKRIYNNDIDISYFPCNVRADEAFVSIDAIYEDMDLVIVSDLSFTESLSKEIDEKWNTDKLFVLDHHDTPYLNEYSWGFSYPHNIKEGNLSCGTRLSHSLLYNIFVDNPLFKKDSMIILNALEEIVSYISAWDTWFCNASETKEDSYELYENKPKYVSFYFKTFKKDFVNKIVDNIFTIHKPLSEDILLVGKTMDKIVQSHCSFAWHNCKIIRGKILVDEELKNVTTAVVFTENYISEIGNYILSHQPEVDVVMCINANVNSVGYRSRNDVGDAFIDVAKLCKQQFMLQNPDTDKCLAGGHPQASGSPLKAFIIDNIMKEISGKYLFYGEENIDSYQKIKSFKYDEENYKYMIDENIEKQ